LDQRQSRKDGKDSEELPETRAAGLPVRQLALADALPPKRHQRICGALHLPDAI
jgi:hypothetical protein